MASALPSCLGGGLVRLPHHLAFLGLPLIGTPVGNGAAFVEPPLRDAGGSFGKLRQNLIEGPRRAGHCLRGIGVEPLLVYFINKMIVGKLYIKSAPHLQRIMASVIFYTPKILISYITSFSRFYKPRPKGLGIFTVLLHSGIACPHLKPYLLRVLPIDKIIRSRLQIGGFESACPGVGRHRQER